MINSDTAETKWAIIYDLKKIRGVIKCIYLFCKCTQNFFFKRAVQIVMFSLTSVQIYRSHCTKESLNKFHSRKRVQNYSKEIRGVHRGGARGACTPLSFLTPLFFSYTLTVGVPNSDGEKIKGGSRYIFREGGGKWTRVVNI